ncbi:hypothetical protein [Bradyrhizobium sp. URHC0002]
MPNMRIVAIAVVMLLSPAVAHASKDCMTRAEARNIYRTSYLYWHGKGRCWDASPRASHRLKKVAAARANRVEASHKTKARPKPEVKVEVADPSPVPTGANGTLTPDDLRKWANSMAAMPSEPIVKILDRWPDEELPQHRIKPAAIAEPSLMNTRTIVMVIIMLMALLAVLIGVTVHRRSSHRMVH